MQQHVFVLAFSAITLVTPAAFAQAVWTGANSSDWFDPGNWAPGSTPDASTGVLIDSGTALLDRPGASIKTLSGAGVIDLGTQTLTITEGTAPAVDGVFSGSILGTGALALTGGTQRLVDVDTGSTTVTVTGQGLSAYDDAVLDLYGASSAGGGTFSVSNAGFIGFHETSTAANATFAVNDGGMLAFIDTADAGSSHITVNSGGVLVFDHEAAADSATLINTANGIVDVSLTGTSTGSVAIGSLTGAGDIYLGSSTLTLGALNRNDTISGIVTDGMSANLQAYFGTSISLSGGSLVKTGTGTLTLTGANSGLTGTSQVLAGTLSVNGILGGMMAVHGGRLQGVGQVGATENFSNGIIAPGNSIGTLTIAGDYAGRGGWLEIEAQTGRGHFAFRPPHDHRQ